MRRAEEPGLLRHVLVLEQRADGTVPSYLWPVSAVRKTYIDEFATKHIDG